MASPFPGMDPYLEGWLWPDVHHSLASEIRRALLDQVSDRYSVRIETSVIEDNPSTDGLVVTYPDVSVHGSREQGRHPGSSALVMDPPPLVLDTPAPQMVRVSSVRVRLARERSLVTAIEIVSPGNKRGKELENFRQKIHHMRQSGVHVVVVDLVRRGTRYLLADDPSSPYLLTVTRAGSSRTEAWPIGLRDVLPRIPVPLLPSDADVAVDLQAVMTEVYAEGRYANDIDYSGALPPPPLRDEDATWLKTRLAESAT